MAGQPGISPTTSHRDQQRGGAALLIIDMINKFDFSGGDRLKTKAEMIAEPILKLRRRIEGADCPVVYVNDNFGEWHSEKSRLVEHAQASAGSIVSRMAPAEDDYFIIKPQFSGFYATNLAVLLPKLGASKLILTGVATDICVLFTAADAHMRDYDLWIPEDCVAACEGQRTKWALEIMRESMGAETGCSDRIDIPEWIGRDDPISCR